RLDPSLLDSFEDSFEGRGRSKNLPIYAIIVQVLPTRLEHDVHEVVLFRGGFRDDDVAFLMEHPGHRARFRHVSAVLAEDVANLAYGAVAVVGIDVEQDRHSTRPVTFERKLFISSAGKLARAPLDRSLDVVGRHIFG